MFSAQTRAVSTQPSEHISFEQAKKLLQRSGSGIYTNDFEILEWVSVVHLTHAALRRANVFKCLTSLADKRLLTDGLLGSDVYARNPRRACDRINGNYLKPYKNHVGLLAIASCSVFLHSALKHPSDVACFEPQLLAVAKVRITETK